MDAHTLESSNTTNCQENPLLSIHLPVKQTNLTKWVQHKILKP
jgi:hypothetical protein